MFRDTSMDYLDKEDVKQIWNQNTQITDEEFLNMYDGFAHAPLP